MVTISHRPAARHTVGRVAFGVLLALHGVAHFAGLTDSLEKAIANAEAEYLGGLWTISDPSTLRVVGVVWAVVGVLVLAASVLVLLHHPLARPVVVAATLVSLAISIAGLWAAVVGVGVNLAVLALAVLVPDRVGLRAPA